VPGPERERIFERFRRGTAQQSGAIAGVGLGLFLSRAIVSHHGGTLTCNAPDDGDGCAFDLVLPTTSTSQTMTEEPQR
jgi:K+-sensing histidine kinase KdpD